MLPSRDASSGRSQVQLNPQKLTPSPEIYLGQLSYLTLATAELLEADSILTPVQAVRQKQLKVAAGYRERHRELGALIAKLGFESVDLEDRYAERIDGMFKLTSGVGWHESVMRLYIIIGILEDSARAVAKGLAAAKRNRVEELLRQSDLSEFCATSLKVEIERRPELAGRLAMYGRSLVADALLEVKNSVSLTQVLAESPEDANEALRAQFKALEPFMSELIAAHTVRMDRLGLTA